ncbi:nucleotidyltransferase family protein [Agromyces binzhouensis]|nr:nucleotidyltransferase family protein [Agromyces binzhouensis]
MRDAVDAYVRRARVLRQIQSNKASRAQRLEVWYLVITVLVATLVSVIGFAGVDRIAELLAPAPTDALDLVPAVETVFNIAVLVVLIATLVGLVFRFGERANRHYRSLEVLTEFMRDCTDLVEMHDARERTINGSDLDQIRTRYKGVLATLPPSTDKEYEKAKNDAVQKRLRSIAAPTSRGEVNPSMLRKVVVRPSRMQSRASKVDARRVASLLRRDPLRIAALRAVHEELGSRAWITGGFLREGVWDAIEGRPIESPRDDVDVIYFDRRDTTKDAERALQKRLDEREPRIRWSVKNQARMHSINGDKPYDSLADAVSRFPETASAVAVQLNSRGFRFLAPIGMDDLRRMRLRPNARANRAAYERRRPQVEGAGRWSLLEVVEPEPPHTSTGGSESVSG